MVAAVRCDAKGTVLECNGRAARLFGRRPAGMVGRAFAPLDPADLRRVCDRQRPANPRQTRFERELVRKDGSRHWIEICTFPLVRRSGRCDEFTCIIQEITGQKRVEEQLRVSNERMRLASRTAGCGIWESNLQTGSQEWDEQMFAIYGYTAETDPGSCKRWTEGILPEDYPLVEQAVATTAKTGQPFDIEFRIRRRDDGRIRHIHGIGAVLYDQQGAPLRLIGTNKDVTARRESEAQQRRLEGQLAQAQKMETLGLLAGGIAHDLNNMLAPIILRSALATQQHPAGSDAHRLGETIIEAANSAREVVQRILAFSRFGPVDKRACEVSAIIEQSSRLIRMGLPVHIQLVVEPIPALAMVADSSQFQHVLLNLATNAIQAMGENRGRLTLAVHQEVLAAEKPTRVGKLPSGRFVAIRVIDTGSGMDEETLGRIFDPFFTTKGGGEGTGLGLSIIRGIVESHGGSIDVASTPGQGSCFTLYLPQA